MAVRHRGHTSDPDSTILERDRRPVPVPEPRPDVLQQATRAMRTIGLLQPREDTQYMELYDALFRYHQLTGRPPFAGVSTLEEAARQFVVDVEQRSCLVPDAFQSGPGGVIKISAYGPAIDRWTKGGLTWSVQVPAGANASALNATFVNAFAQWRAASANFFTFTQVPSNGDLRISFGGSQLDDDFGALGGVLGSSDGPQFGGIYFDNVDFPANTVLNPQGGGVIGALLPIALHEIGHALGLGHSTAANSIMYPKVSATAIDAESVTALRELYFWTPLRRYPDWRSSSDGPTFATASAFTFASSLHRLAMAWKGSGGDSNIWYSTTEDLATWTPQVPIDGVRSSHGPALAAFPASGPSPVLYLAWKGEGNDNRLFWTRSVDHVTFEPHKHFNDGRLSSTRPAMATFAGRLVMAWKSSHDEQIYWSWFNGLNWSAQEAIAGRATSHAPALATDGNQLFMFWKGSGNDTRIFYATLGPGPSAIWSGGDEVSFLRPVASGMIKEVVNTDSHPAAVARGNSIILVFKGQPGDTAVWFMPFTNGSFSAPFTVPGAGTYTGPGVALLNSSLVVSWKALDPDSELHLSTLG